jgi:tetratricopeptide (TPR) repeat protein
LRAKDLCRHAEQKVRIFAIQWGLCAFHISRAAFPAALPLTEQLMGLASALREPLLLQDSHFLRGVTLFYTGDFTRAEEYFDVAINGKDPRDPISVALQYNIQPQTEQSRAHIVESVVPWLPGARGPSH